MICVFAALETCGYIGPEPQQCRKINQFDCSCEHDFPLITCSDYLYCLLFILVTTYTVDIV